MTVLNAFERALPPKPGVGSLSLKYLPEYGGYVESAVGDVSNEGAAKFWWLCLLPIGPGSEMITLPLFPNKILVS